jgi:hypothetical protein
LQQVIAKKSQKFLTSSHNKITEHSSLPFATKITKLPSLPLTTKSQTSHHFLSQQNYKSSLTFSHNKITNLFSLLLTTKSQTFPHFLSQQNHKLSPTSSHNKITNLPSLSFTTKSQTFPHFLSQQNHNRSLTSSHNKTFVLSSYLLSNFYLFPHFLSDNLFNPHNLLPTVPSLEENDIKTALSVSRINLIYFKNEQSSPFCYNCINTLRSCYFSKIKYVCVSLKIQIVLSSNLEINSLEVTFPLTFLHNEGILKRG